MERWPMPFEMAQNAACGLVERLWHFTARYAPRGDLGKHRPTAIARRVSWPGDPDDLLEVLQQCGLVDDDEQHGLIVHDWHEHADESVRKVLRGRGEEFVSSAGAQPAYSVREVYLAQDGKEGPVKIGLSSDPKRRVRELRSTLGRRELRVVATVVGDASVESTLHSRFRGFAVGGPATNGVDGGVGVEWFRPDPEIFQWFESNRGRNVVGEASVGVGQASPRAPSEPEPSHSHSQAGAIAERRADARDPTASGGARASPEPEPTLPPPEVTPEIFAALRAEFPKINGRDLRLRAKKCFEHYRGKGERRVDWIATPIAWIYGDQIQAGAGARH